ncbi:MAG: hypothetical protein AW11_01600 [Candidatus Accumulibacter regalis]|uniref:HPr-rel-A system PqqD family protein n=1 Tax=Accumulibacter regalis TaxID=522306 RepID=A0A011QIU8_ACCRE|nr:HPr-rel-A system PqqD family peptide chaperone [Accumulibacter sp.]EXI89277.1 MAG: hypothetical protein AW11_01600 [Candidatus Accumulibacter regalis]MBN8513709.1 HPr-rel-A system PqqD family peptide chaperone [Accumulibacter sp.]MBO3701213.1 HPr-rel-A system PqqD family peptide chaperone [Accumulibacter sp.]HRE69289.1 HPr-rel-A system PqqD family peptide chaperone [Accumulibacter sp.]HRE86897.1 HPr-rel-A system PqqD family peptide chaperone [Accumulibacter sp.]
MTRLLYRQLGDGAVVFDTANWHTHILTPAAAVIFEVFAEAGNGDAIAESRALELLREELDVDPGSPEMQQVLRSLQEMGMLAG